MTKITFIEHDGTQHTVEANSDMTVMEAAIDNLVPGIDADCGGQCSCATCHVIVEEKWFEVVGEPTERENEMLDMHPEREKTSRLSCQVPVTEKLDGLTVTLPEYQI